jgi:hypothetical protein
MTARRLDANREDEATSRVLIQEMSCRKEMSSDKKTRAIQDAVLCAY